MPLVDKPHTAPLNTSHPPPIEQRAKHTPSIKCMYTHSPCCVLFQISIKASLTDQRVVNWRGKLTPMDQTHVGLFSFEMFPFINTNIWRKSKVSHYAYCTPRIINIVLIGRPEYWVHLIFKKMSMFVLISISTITRFDLVLKCLNFHYEVWVRFWVY